MIFEDDPKSEAGKRRVVVPSFLGPKGARPTRNNFHTIWDKARKAAGIPNLHLHDLRHTGNALAAETGATLREQMDRMGHASTRAALIYLHAREQRGTEIAQGIDAMVSRATKKPSRKRAAGERGRKGHARARGDRRPGVRSMGQGSAGGLPAKEVWSG